MSGTEGVHPQVSTRDLVRWAEALAGVARTGLGFTENLYEQERFQEVLKIAADIRAAAEEEREAEHQFEEWLRSVGMGVAGYVTPKVAVAAVVGDDEGRMLLTQRSDSGVWLYPVGWADVGYSPSEVAVKEVYEETGIEVEPVRLVAVFDGLRLGFALLPLYSIVFQCRVIGGELKGHPLETRDVGFFARDALPQPLAGGGFWVEVAFRAIAGEEGPTFFDPPREPPWKGDPDAI
ncbi:MAG: NUDIX hydrolase N-terminal domain-containing protein [Actinobacteria bacterium]|nr:NUDIX hydrolase N-terminal domain-containing protein [Actinomycetota bacterium]